MIKWEAWVNRMAEVYVVMIRNHKTSYGLVAFETKTDAGRQADKINKYPIARKIELYKEAMNKGIVCKRHEELSFEADKHHSFTVEKGEACYGLTIWIDGQKYLVAKRKYKKDVVALLKEWKAEHSEIELVHHFRQKVRKAKSEQIRTLLHK